jgi:glutathione peroxidase
LRLAFGFEAITFALIAILEPFMTSAYDFSAASLSGEEIPLAKFRGKVLLIVNTASKCGFTVQYSGLEKLHRKYKEQGFEVLGFPCNQFGNQEPGDAGDIEKFCSLHYDVTFPMFAKVDVNGKTAHPLFKFLKHAKPGSLGLESIKWNFTKFLIDRRGAVVARFSPVTWPEELEVNIEALL